MSGGEVVGRLIPAHLEWRVNALERSRDDQDARLRRVEGKLAWIMGGLALLVVEVPVVLFFFTR